jgi:hypothetical protein
MEFVDYGPDDDEPFPDRYDPVPGMQILPFESLSIPLEARALGRQDEPWLIQVIVSQRLVHTHLAIVANKAGLVVETVAHLQMSVKTQPEIDATFIATIRESGPSPKRIRAYMTGEAKQFGERILEHQIREQVSVAFAGTRELSGDEAIHAVIPIVFKVVEYEVETASATPKRERGIYIAQFEMIKRVTFDTEYKEELHEMLLNLQSRAFYVPSPPIRGISYKKLPRKPAA